MGGREGVWVEGSGREGVWVERMEGWVGVRVRGGYVG